MPRLGCHYFKWEGGGELPRELDGLYTCVNKAKDSVMQWQASKFPSRRKTNIEVVLDGETRD